MRLSIRTKLVLALCGISLVSAFATGWMAYRRGIRALTEAAFDRVTAVRVSKRDALLDFLHHYRELIRNESRNPAVIEATEEFTAAFEELNGKGNRVNSRELAELRNHYDTRVIPTIRADIGDESITDRLMPDNSAGRYLQWRYLVKNPHPEGEKQNLVDAGDEVAYSQVHARHHGMFARAAKEFDCYDILILDPRTHHVIYSVRKEIDLGVSLSSGIYSGTRLAQAVREIDDKSFPDEVRLCDFDFYLPSAGQPAAFVISPIHDGRKLKGIMVIQLAIDQFNRVMNGEAAAGMPGLGRTGEVYLIGNDGFMRSDSRYFREDREEYAKSLAGFGYASSIIERVKSHGTTIGILPRNRDAIRQIFEQREGADVIEGHDGKPKLASYSTLNMQGLEWAIVAKVDPAEALAHAHQALYDGLTIMGVILGLSMVGALVVSNSLARPIMRLHHAARAYANGFTQVRVKVDSRDEVGELADAFNRMAAEIEAKTEKLSRRVKENRKLLQNMMPAGVMARFRSKAASGGPESFYGAATLAFVEIGGLDRMFDELDSDRSESLLDELIARFDMVAKSHSVERLFACGGGYLVSSGLKNPQMDHTVRVLKFAEELQWIVDAFNAEHVTFLYASIGVHRCPITTGHLGRQNFVNELWSRVIDLSHDMDSSDSKTKSPGEKSSSIRVSDEVLARMKGSDDFQFEPCEMADGTIVWSLKVGSGS